jgi:predicted lactoylglutathione lyase
MAFSPVVVSLPIADRRTSFEFYGRALGLEAIGQLADDGVPEPLQFALNDGLRLMLVPTGGFGWVTGGRDVAQHEQSECLLSLPRDANADVDALVERACAAGAELLTEPGEQPWGYAGVFADPDGHLWMVTSAPLA